MSSRLALSSSASRFAMKVFVIRKRFGGRRSAARTLSSTHISLRQARRLSVRDIRGSSELIPREGCAVPRGREHLLFRHSELRERLVADDVCDRAAGWNAGYIRALWEARAACFGHRPHGGDGSPRSKAEDD